MSFPHHIMVVDDDDDILEIVKLTLEMEPGLQVTCCNSGQKALETIVSAKPDLILLDVMMPGKDGPATLAELRKIEDARNIPAIFLTARAQPGEMQSYVDMGAIGALSKPFDPMRLLQDIRSVCKQPHAAQG